MKLLVTISLTGLILLAKPAITHAQTVLDDTQGRSSLLLPVTYVGLNSAEETIKAGYFFDPYSIRTVAVDTLCEDEEQSLRTLISKKDEKIQFGEAVYSGRIKDTKWEGASKECPRPASRDCETIQYQSVTRIVYQRDRTDPAKPVMEIKTVIHYCIAVSSREKYRSFFFGVQGQAKNVGGVATLFSQGNFSLDSKANLFVGKHSIFFPEFKRAEDKCKFKFNTPERGKPFLRDWLTLRIGYQAAKYYTFDKTLPWRDQLQEHKFRGASVGLYYNVNIDGKFLVGLASGYQRVSNYDGLDEISVLQRYTGTNAAKDSTRIVDKKVNAGLGTFQPFHSPFFYADIVYLLYSPAKPTFFALNGYLRVDRYLNDKYIRRAGIGAYLLNPKSGAVNLGLFVEQSDWTNATESENDFGKRIRAGLTLKFPIGTVFVAPKSSKAKVEVPKS